MSIIRVKQFVNAVIYPIFGFSECIGLAIMHAAASCCTPISDKNIWTVHFCLKTYGYYMECIIHDDACIDRSQGTFENVLYDERNHRKLPKNEPSQKH
jgi:hypothetical protein